MRKFGVPDLGLASRHRYLNGSASSKRQDSLWLGYPDEILAFSAFADSLIKYGQAGKWVPAYPITVERAVAIVDFVSPSEEDANALLRFGWTISFEQPAVTDEIFSHRRVNQQNNEGMREIAIVATGTTHLDYKACVGHRLPRADDPRHKKEKLMNFYDVITAVGDGIGVSEVYLVSKWKPGRELRAKLADHLFNLVWRPLAGVPSEVLNQICHVHYWHGSRRRGRNFLADVWRRR